MINRPVSVRILLISAVFTLVAAAVPAAENGAPQAAVPAAPGAFPPVVAKVNGKSIEALDLKRAKTVLTAALQGRPITPEQEKELEKQALSQLVSAELLYQAAQKTEIKDLDRLVEEKVIQGKKRFPTQQDFEKAIKALEMDEKDLRAFTRRDLIISTFVEQNFASRITVGEEESKRFYEQNLDKFKQEEAVRASHILVGIDAKATAEDRQKAREKAEALRKQILAGADFAAVAKENSTCPSSRQGGDLGYFGKGRMVPAFEQAAFALKPGEVSGVVETQFGFHIIKTVDSKKGETISFQEAKSRIHEYLKGQKVSAAISAHLAEARKTAQIEILLK